MPIPSGPAYMGQRPPSADHSPKWDRAFLLHSIWLAWSGMGMPKLRRFLPELLNATLNGTYENMANEVPVTK